MPLDNDPPDPAAIMDATGLKAFQLAFVLAPNGGGVPDLRRGSVKILEAASLVFFAVTFVLGLVVDPDWRRLRPGQRRGRRRTGRPARKAAAVWREP